MSGARRTGATTRRLRLRPFRGLRYDTDRLDGRLAPLLAPPYDAIDAAGRDLLEARSGHNVVRLTLPRASDGIHAARTVLSRWRASGVLRREDAPSLYVVERDVDGDVHRLVVGVLDVPGSDDVGLVLPHEDVMPAPVADRLALRAATMADLEPVLLVTRGAPSLPGVVADAVAASGPPMQVVGEDDPWTLRVVGDPDSIAAVTGALDGATALIADGHHRWAAIGQHRRALRDATGPGPWDAALVAIAVGDLGGLSLGPIHRTVSDLSVERAARALAGGPAPYLIARDGLDAEALATAAGRTPGALGLVDDAGSVLAVPLDPAVTTAAVAASPRGRGHSDAWCSLVTASLHEVVLPQRWQAEESRVRYHHDVVGALAAGRVREGLAVLLPAVDTATVVELARRGERMPRKSTSFGPKPPSGLVIRLLDE